MVSKSNLLNATLSPYGYSQCGSKTLTGIVSPPQLQLLLGANLILNTPMLCVKVFI